MKKITKRIITYLLAFAVVFSSAIAIQPAKTEAASVKYVKSLKVSTKVSVAVGAKKTVKVTVKAVGKANTKVKVKSSDKKIVTASYSKKTKKITLTGISAGSAKVTVMTAAKNKKGKAIKKTIKVTVTKNGASSTPTTIAVTSVSLSESTAFILKGNSKQLFATVTPNNATDRTLKWSSSAPAVAIVSNAGLVKAVNRGTAVITVENTASRKKAACTVTVLDEVTATTQDELEKALSSNYTGRIILKPSKGAEITIPSGNYEGTNLVVEAEEESRITNNGIFGNVAVSGGTYNENASVNSLLITGVANVKISGNSSVDVTVAIADNSADEKVKLENNGTISDLAIQSAGSVAIDGTSSSNLPIPVSIRAKDVTLSSNQNVEVNATEKAKLVLTGDTDQTTVTVDKEANLPDVFGVGFIPYTVTETGVTGTIAAEVSEDLGPVDIQGLVRDAYTGDVLSDVDIYLIPYKDYNEGNLSENPKKTDAGGNYQYEQVKSGNYYLVMQKEGYKDAIQLLTASSRFNTVYINEVMELLNAAREDNETAAISGIVKDAANGNGIAGITVELRKNKGNIIGNPIETAVTGDDGSYSFENCAADQYTLKFQDKRETEEEKYILLSKNVCVKADQNVDGNTTLSKPIKGSGIRFVLTWGSEGEGVPSDLDTHLFAPTIDGGYKEIYYSSMYYNIGNQVYAMLDVDDTNYDGPETATILSDLKGIYYYYVYNYDTDGNLPTSKARVDVYSGNELLTSYNVPSQPNSGDWWKVCSYNSANGSIISYNSILDELDFDQEYTNNDMQYIQSMESSFGINWSESFDGLYIRSSAESLDMLKNDLTVEMADGYSFAWKTSTEDGVTAILDILKDGRKVGYYNVYYSYSVIVDIDITGAGVARYSQDDDELEIYIYSAVSIDYDSLTYTVSDQRFEAAVEEDDRGDMYLVIRGKETKEEIQRYYLYNETGYYITDVTGSYIQRFREQKEYVDVYYNEDYENVLDWNDVGFTFVNGYTGEVVRQEDEDNSGYYTILQIKDSSGNNVVTKSLYWEW